MMNTRIQLTLLEDILNTYEKIFEINSKINDILKNYSVETFNEVAQGFIVLLEQKDELIKDLQTLKEKNTTEFKKIAENEVAQVINKIKNLEDENIRLATTNRDFLSQQIGSLNVSSKALSAYKFDKHEEPAIFDQKDTYL